MKAIHTFIQIFTVRGRAFMASSVPTLVVLLIAAITRCWRLNYHSVWFDEAVSLQWAAGDIGFIWQKSFPLVEDKHPPVYYLALHAWQQMMHWFGLGQNDGALRALGSLLGVLTVWGILRLAQALSGHATGLLTGLLTALSPVLVWYSQELRMFQPVTTVIVWAGYFLLRAWQANRRWVQLVWWLSFVVVLEAALYSYLFSAFILPAAGLTLLSLTVYTKALDRWQRFFSGARALTLAGLLFLPLAYNAWVVNGNEGDPGRAFANFGPTLWRLLRVFTLWRVDWPALVITGSLCFFAFFILLGLLFPAKSSIAQPNKKNPRQSALSAFYLDRFWLLLWIGLPLLIGNLLLSRSASVFAEDRYFIYLAPFVLWALARGVVLLAKRWPFIGVGSGLLAGVLLVAALPPLWSPALARENWRAAANYIANYHLASPGLRDAVVAHVDYTRLPLLWYLRQQFTFEELPLFHPYGGALTPEQVESVIAPPLEGLVNYGAATLWLTQSHLNGVDDQRLVEGWLNAHFPLVTEQFPTGVKLSGYALQHHFQKLPILSASALYPATELAPGLQLAACEILTPHLTAQDDQMHPPSGWVHVRLWWQATGAIGDDYIASAELVGPEGAWGVRLYRENESLRRWPTRTWKIGEIVRDEVDINLNPVTPPRTYPVLIGLMDSADQSAGTKVECGEVQVE